MYREQGGAMTIAKFMVELMRYPKGLRRSNEKNSIAIAIWDWHRVYPNAGHWGERRRAQSGTVRPSIAFHIEIAAHGLCAHAAARTVAELCGSPSAGSLGAPPTLPVEELAIEDLTRG
jgi:hypothetical protein